MKKHISFWLLFSVMSMHNVDAARGERKALEFDPYYGALKQEVEILRSYRYALRGARSIASWLTYLRLLEAGPRVLQAVTPMLDAQKTFLMDMNDQDKAEKAEIEQRKFLTIVAIEVGTPLIGGAIAGAIISELSRQYTFWLINHVLGQHKTGYNFRKLPIDEAVMVLAAYKKMPYIMRKLKPFMHHFLEKPGVWQALAQLYFFKSSWWRPTAVDVYFGSVSPENVEKLKEMLE